jgi:hypothetical protein
MPRRTNKRLAELLDPKVLLVPFPSPAEPVNKLRVKVRPADQIQDDYRRTYLINRRLLTQQAPGEESGYRNDDKAASHVKSVKNRPSHKVSLRV